jgi:Septum formation
MPFSANGPTGPTQRPTTPRLREGYATAEVDAFRKELRDTFLGARQPPLTWDEVQRKWPGSEYHPWFSTTRGWSRPGYDVQEVDAFLKMTKLRLAAIRLLEPGSWPILRVDRPAAPPVSGTIADRPAAQPPDTVKVRGRLRAVWLALWLAGAAALVLVGVYGYIPGETPEPHRQYLSVSLFVAALLVVIGVRTVGRGLDADGNGVVVRNTLRATPIPWRELAAIEFKGDSEVWNISGWYYKLVFQRHDGSRVTAEAPASRGTGPGEYLFELRERLLAMRSAALGDPHAPADRPSDAASTDASNPTTPTDTPPTTATWPLLDTPSTATWPLLNEPSLPPAATNSRWKHWGAPAAGAAVAVAVAVSIAHFGPDLLLGDDDDTADRPVVTAETAAPDPTAAIPNGQSVYWEDLKPGMCIPTQDPSAIDVIVVDCSAEHEDEVTSTTALTGSEEWPGDNAVDKAGEKKCKSAFASYVGLGIDESRLDLDFWTVDQDGWTDGKVTLICLVLDPTNDHLTRSLRGAHE